ncbi:hypothetical protein BDY24DRAFT_412079 [Mrakia frigida]|uniref:uncharacterized protein n=1 Tax=Mrakia frigida TaxID=29902 RepID=UPI003FCC17C3
MDPSTSSSLDSDLPSYNTDILVIVPNDQLEGDGQLKEQGRGWLYRHAGNSLLGRALEATVGTVHSSATSVSCISPWGDNNPVIFPCVRVRDIAMMGLVGVTGGLFGAARAVVGESIYGLPSSFFFATTVAGQFLGGLANEEASQWVFKKTVENTLDHEIRRVLTTDEVVTLEIALKHRLLNQHAQLGFFKPPLDSPSSLSRLPSSFKEALDTLSSLKGVQQTSTASLAAFKAYFDWSKGWFSPYLMASQRTPAIPRQEKPTAIMSYGPFIEADYLFAQHIAASTSQIIPFCEPDPAVDCDFSRMFVGFLGISPFRGVWNQSRRPNEAKLLVHIANGVPGLILPVLPGTPLTSWDACPLLTLLRLPYPSPEWTSHVKSITVLLCSLIDWDHVVPSTPEEQAEGAVSPRESVERAIELVFDGVRMLKGVSVVKKKIDGERSGVVMLRFGNSSLFAKEPGFGSGLRKWGRMKKGKEKEDEEDDSEMTVV